MEKAEEYAFLDPFAAEFEYSARKIKYSGQAGGFPAEADSCRFGWTLSWQSHLARLERPGNIVFF